MTTCPSCNSSITEAASFCSVCGSTFSTPGGTAVARSAPMSANVASLLSYTLGFITGILFLVLDPYKSNPDVRFHAFQSIFFSVVLFAFWIVWMTLSSAAGFATFGLLGLAMAGLGVLIAVGTFVYWLFLMYKAYQGERYCIPYIGVLASSRAHSDA